MAELELTDAVWPPLVHLDRSGDGISQIELASRCGIDGSTLVRLLDILEKRDLIARRVSPQDRRARLIFLTDAGRELLVQVYQVLQEAEQDMLMDVGDEALLDTLSVFDLIEDRLAGDVKSQG